MQLYQNLTYCCEVWDIFGENQSQRLQKLQNRCARIIMDMGNEANNSNRQLAC